MIDPDRVEELMSELEDSPSDRGREAIRREPPSPPSEEPGSGGDELGEEAELRRALEVLEELMELRPDDPDLRARRIRYLRRLGAEERRTEEERELAGDLAKEGHPRAARLLCRLILDRHPEESGARELLSSLRPEGQYTLADSPEGRSNGATTPAELSSDGDLREIASRELAIRVEALPWLSRARRTLDADGECPEAFRYYARYLLVRGRTDEAYEVLTSMLEEGAEDPEIDLDLRTDLVECLIERGRRDEAREHLQGLARRDGSFAVVWSVLE